MTQIEWAYPVTLLVLVAGVVVWVHYRERRDPMRVYVDALARASRRLDRQTGRRT